MIPYFQVVSFNLGPITIYVWGLMVALGILAGVMVSAISARKKGLDEKIIWDMSAWAIMGAFVVARLFHVIYEPQVYFNDPLELFRLWHGGYSVIGGFIGAVIVGIIFLKRKKVDVLAYVDCAVFGLPLGLFIGRIGCFLIHDHPGTFTNFILGVGYPDGVRHDHGLYLSLNGLVLFLFFLLLTRMKIKKGTYIVVFLIWYGVVRFLLDFLRATDGIVAETRYYDLTPAQYAAVVMVAIGAWLFFKKNIFRFGRGS